MGSRTVNTEHGAVRLGDFQEVYSMPGRYLNDHCLICHNGVWHLFGIVGATRPSPDAPLEEVSFAHATSADLFAWEAHPDVMHKTGEWPEERAVCAPFVIERDGVYHMFYDACDVRDKAQWMCLATSRDLFEWERYPGNPVAAPSLSWAKWPGYKDSPGVSGSCRDPHVILLGDGRYVMYYTVDLPDENEARMVGIAAAVSKNLAHWQDYGPVYCQEHWAVPGAKVGVRSTESCCVHFKDDRYWLFFSNGLWTNYVVSDNPLDFTRQPVQRLGYAHAAEIFSWKEQWWITHCSSDPDNFTHRETNRTRGLFLARLSWPSGGHPELP